MYCRKYGFNNPTTLQNCENKIFDPNDRVLKPCRANLPFVAGKTTSPPALESSVKTDLLIQSIAGPGIAMRLAQIVFELLAKASTAIRIVMVKLEVVKAAIQTGAGREGKSLKEWKAVE